MPLWHLAQRAGDYFSLRSPNSRCCFPCPSGGQTPSPAWGSLGHGLGLSCRNLPDSSAVPSSAGGTSHISSHISSPPRPSGRVTLQGQKDGGCRSGLGFCSGSQTVFFFDRHFPEASQSSCECCYCGTHTRMHPKTPLCIPGTAELLPGAAHKPGPFQTAATLQVGGQKWGCQQGHSAWRAHTVWSRCLCTEAAAETTPRSAELWWQPVKAEAASIINTGFGNVMATEGRKAAAAPLGWCR